MLYGFGFLFFLKLYVAYISESEVRKCMQRAVDTRSQIWIYLLDIQITISVKKERRSTITACTYRCPEQQLGIYNFE